MENEVINPEQDNALKAARKAAVEAIVYVAEDPVTIDQIASALGSESAPGSGESARQNVLQALQSLQEEYRRDDRGLEVREIAGGYKMFTKAEHHETLGKVVNDLPLHSTHT